MPIGTPTVIATATSTSSGSGMTTSADAPAGSLIVVCCGNNDNPAPQTISSVQDSAGNPYSAAVISDFPSNPNIYNMGILYCSNTPYNLPSGGSITVNLSDSETYYAVAFYVTGCNGGLDTTPTPVEYSSGTQSPSISSGTLAVANELIVTILNDLRTPFTEGSGFTALDATDQNANQDDIAYKIVSSIASVTYAPSWTGTASDATVAMASFKATSGALAPFLTIQANITVDLV